MRDERIPYEVAEPSEDDLPGGVPLVKPPVKGTMRYVVLSTTPLRIYVHYLGRSTVDCPGPLLCDHCAIGKEKRYKIYLFAISNADRQRKLLELTAATWLNLKSAMEANGGSSKGLLIELSRRGQKEKGEHQLKCDGIYGAKDSLPEVPSPWAVLKRIFRIPGKRTPINLKEEVPLDLDMTLDHRDLAVIREASQSVEFKQLNGFDGP